MGFFDKIKKIGIFNGFSKLTDEFYDELEESLILADMGMDTTMKAVDELRRRTKERRIKDTEGARNCMKEILAEMLTVGDLELDLSTKPSVVLFIGVNGVGKTTTIGKIGHDLDQQGKKVIFAAADTSALPPPSSSPSGRSAAGWRSSSRARAPILPLWYLTPCLLPRPETPMWCSSTPPDVCTTRLT